MAYISGWFKVIKNGEIIGVVTDQSFARYSASSKRIHICNATNGQYVIVNDHFYRDDWLLPLCPDDHTDYEKADVISITEKEYDILTKFEEREPDNVRLINTDPEENERPLKKEETVTIEYVREHKFNELRKECQRKIESGFDLVLTDGISHHFSMSLVDQINLLNLQQSLMAGDDVIYHADGELEQFYSLDDAKMILLGARKWREYHIAVFNSLKNWINHLDDIEKINSIEYDSEIPDEYITNVLQVIVESF